MVGVRVDVGRDGVSAGGTATGWDDEDAGRGGGDAAAASASLGLRRIAREVGCSRMTAQRYLAVEGWVPFRTSSRASVLAGREDWLSQRFRQHRGNADVVRQELLAEHGVAVSLRMVERAVAHMRREWLAEARATVRFETPQGQQLQIDFGERQVRIGEESVRAHLFMATLGYSRRVYAQAFHHGRQVSWF